MNKEYLRQLSQLVQNQPISVLEFKELVLRHLLSCPDDGDSVQRNISSHLLQTYLVMMPANNNEYIVNDWLKRGDEVIKSAFKEYFNVGFAFGKEEQGVMVVDYPNYWPRNLPTDLTLYPSEIIKQFAAVMGYQKARSIQI